MTAMLDIKYESFVDFPMIYSAIRECNILSPRPKPTIRFSVGANHEVKTMLLNADT